MKVIVTTDLSDYSYEDYFKAMYKYKALTTLGISAKYKIILD